MIGTEINDAVSFNENKNGKNNKIMLSNIFISYLKYENNLILLNGIFYLI
jgi:hypothetical protein